MTYDEILQSITDKATELREAQVANVRKTLDNLRKEFAGEIATTEWEAYNLPKMEKAAADISEFFAEKYNAEILPDLTETSWTAGGEMIDMTSGIEVMSALPAYSETAVGIASNYYADLITNLASDMKKKITESVTLGLLGGKSFQETMADIGKNLDDPSVFGSIATRAETIARTESARINSAARQARIQQVTDENPQMKYKKKWIHSGKAHPRKNHLALSGVEVPINQKFPGNISYPHAPGLPAGEVINCGCTHVLVMEDKDKLLLWGEERKARKELANAQWENNILSSQIENLEDMSWKELGILTRKVHLKTKGNREQIIENIRSRYEKNMEIIK